MSLTGNYDRNNRGKCYICIRAVKWIPVIFILAIIMWSYFAYAVQLCFFTIQNVGQRIVYLLMYHVVFAMFFWSYWQTIFTDVGLVPPKFQLPRADLHNLAAAENEEAQRRILENFAKDLPVLNRTMTGAVRFCDKCQHVKPDRAHHCSVCGVCVLKMDHHCPWVNNCVNFTNYKFFILFLGYALIYCLYIGATSLEFFILFWKGELEGMGRFHILFLFFVSVMFAISLVSLFGYHCYLVLLNRSTLESFRAPIFRSIGPDKNGFSLGKQANFQEVFGDNKKLWLLPIFSSLGDGVQYPTQTQHQLPSYESMGDTTTQSYLSQGVSIKFLAWSFKMGKSTVREIIIETCSILWKILSPLYVSTPNTADFLEISKQFWEKWNMPNCIGAIDGKHIIIQCPPRTGSDFYNYKKNFSIVLLATCDANYTFSHIAVGARGSQSDGGILKSSIYGKQLHRNEIPIPPNTNLPNSLKMFPHYFIGDAAFPLQKHLHPYSHSRITSCDVTTITSLQVWYSLSRLKRCLSFGVITII